VQASAPSNPHATQDSRDAVIERLQQHVTRLTQEKECAVARQASASDDSNHTITQLKNRVVALEQCA
jgi:polyhydroxyalkanoate synthesis regulator phasin